MEQRAVYPATPLTPTLKHLDAAISPSRADNSFAWLAFTSPAHREHHNWAFLHHAILDRRVMPGDYLIGVQKNFNRVFMVRAFTDWSDGDPQMLFGVFIPDLDRFHELAPCYTREGQTKRARFLEDAGLLPANWYRKAFPLSKWMSGPKSKESRSILIAYLRDQVFPWRKKLGRPHALMRHQPGCGTGLIPLIKVEGSALETRTLQKTLPTIV
jgi:hypothetical protein